MITIVRRNRRFFYFNFMLEINTYVTRSAIASRKTDANLTLGFPKMEAWLSTHVDWKDDDVLSRLRPFVDQLLVDYKY